MRTASNYTILVTHFWQMRMPSLADGSPAHWAPTTGRTTAQKRGVLQPAFGDNKLIC